jgi:hypothetical protein
VGASLWVSRDSSWDCPLLAPRRSISYEADRLIPDGQAGLRHDRGAEKHLRDTKLMQIYEGTNQLNRLNLFKYLIARCVPGAKVFEERGRKMVGNRLREIRPWTHPTTRN